MADKSNTTSSDDENVNGILRSDTSFTPLSGINPYPVLPAITSGRGNRLSSVVSSSYVEFEPRPPCDIVCTFHGTETTVLITIKTLILNMLHSNILVIVGKVGIGKTTIGHQLMFHLRDTFITNKVSSVTECLQILKFDEDQFIFFDDVFGRDIQAFDEMKWKIFYQKWKDAEHKKRKNSKRTILVMSSRSNCMVKNIRFGYQLIDLDGTEHVLTIADKLNVYRFYQTEFDDTSESQTLQDTIVHFTPNDIGFPLCSRLFSQYFHRIVIKFFESPLQFLLQEYKSMVDRYDEARYLSSIMAICNGIFEIDNVLPNIVMSSVMVQTELNHTDILNFADSMMKPFFNVEKTDVIQFVHPCLLTASEIFFFNGDQGQAIKCISLGTIVTYVRSISVRSVCQQEGYYKLKVKQLQTKDLGVLAERLLQDILHGNVRHVCTHTLLGDSILVAKICKLIKEKGDDILINLFSVEDIIEGQSVLYWAAYYNKRVFCNKLLQLFAKCMKCDSDLSPVILSRALIGACLHKTEMVLIFNLVKYGANINYCAECNTEVTNENMRNRGTGESHLCPLDAVVLSKHVRAFRYLMTKGAQIPHSYWIRWDLISCISCISQRSFDLIMALQLSFSTFGQNENAMQSKGESVAVIAKMLNKIDKRNLDNINEIFLVFLLHGYMNPTIYNSFYRCGLNVNYLDKKKRNIIHACLWEYKDNPSSVPFHAIGCFQFLLSKQCDPNNVAIDGSFPLSLVVGKTACNIEVFEMLLSAGANPDKMTPNGLTPLHLCIKSDMPEKDKISLISLLIKFGCDLDIHDRTGKSYGQMLFQSRSLHPSILAKVSKFPLHDCLLSKLNEAAKIDTVEALVNTHNVDINVKDQKGRTALLISATSICSRNISEILLMHGADANILFESNSSIVENLLQSKQKNVSDILEILLAYKVDIRHMNDDGDTVVHSALRCNTKRYNEIRIMLRDCGLDILEHKNKNNQSVLHLCASCNVLDDSEALDICKTYISVCPSVDERDAFDKIPLEYAASCPKSRTQTITYLLNYSSSFQNPDTFLLDLVQNGHICDDICTVLQGNAFFKNTVEDDDYILHKLSSIAPKTKAQIKCLISKLCDAGADINKKDDNGNSALIIACINTMNIGLISVLVDHGADVNLQNENGNTALHECILTASSDTVLTHICKIIADASFDWSIRNSSWSSVLHCLIDNLFSEQEQTFKMILQFADFNMVDSFGVSVLHKIVMLDENDINVNRWLKTILLTGLEIDTEIKESSDRTVLNLACCYNRYSRINTILTLLNHGCDVNTLDEFGHSPLYNVINCLVGHDIVTKFERFSRVCLLLSFNSNAVDANSLLELCQSHGYEDIRVALINNDNSIKTDMLSSIVNKLLGSKPNVLTDVPVLSLDAVSFEIGSLIQKGYLGVCQQKINVDDDIFVGSDFLFEDIQSPHNLQSSLLCPTIKMQDFFQSSSFTSVDMSDDEEDGQDNDCSVEYAVCDDNNHYT